MTHTVTHTQTHTDADSHCVPQVIAQLKRLEASAHASHKFDKAKWKQTLGSLLSLWKENAVSGRSLSRRRSSVHCEDDELIPDNQEPISSFVMLEFTKTKILVCEDTTSDAELVEMTMGMEMEMGMVYARFISDGGDW